MLVCGCEIGTINVNAGDVSGPGISSIIALQIGPWNMDLTATVSVAHGIDYTKIRSLQILIIRDTPAATTTVRDFTTLAGSVAGGWGIDSTNIVMTRTAAGLFDNTNYDDAVMNRGFITIGLAS